MFEGGDPKGTAVDLRSPSGFVRSIGLRPTAMQQAILEKFTVIDTFTSLYDKRNEIARVFALALLWQTLAVRGSKTTVISSCDDTGMALISFLKQVLRTGPQQLLDICNFTSNETIQFGTDPGWNLMYLRTLDLKVIAKRGMHSKVCLILRENTSEVAFAEAVSVLGAAMKQPGRRIIHLW